MVIPLQIVLFVICVLWIVEFIFRWNEVDALSQIEKHFKSINSSFCLLANSSRDLANRTDHVIESLEDISNHLNGLSKESKSFANTIRRKIDNDDRKDKVSGKINKK